MSTTRAPQSTGRASYLLLMALLPPMGTLVMVVYFFSRLAPTLEIHGVPEALAIRLIAVGAGMSSIMAALALVVLLVINRQRARLERANKRLTEMVSQLIEERVRMTRNLEALNGANQVTLAIKQESSFERIATVVLEQIEFFSKATDIVVFAASREGELDPRARRLNGINSFGRDIDGENLECELPYEALIKNSPCRVLESRTANYSIAIPYATQEGMKGVVLVRRNVLEDPDFEADLANFEGALIQLVRLVSVGLKFATLWDRAIKDEMTGLYNKNHFNAELPRLIAAAQKNSRSFSLIMLDIDKFKSINDQCGHLAGDHVLRQVASILIETLRDSDMAFRFGGEELCVVCNGTVAENAAKFAERLRQILAHTEVRFDGGGLIPVSASFGVAEFNPASMAGEKDLKDACDRALYEAKNGGRNLVVVHRGGESFETLERGGDVATEVKRRLGLAGDNTPLVDPANAVDRRAPQTADAVSRPDAEGEAAPADGDVNTAPAKPSHAASIRKVAEEMVAAVAAGDGAALAEFAQIAGIAAQALQESRRVKLGGEPADSQPAESPDAAAKPESVAGKGKPRNRRNRADRRSPVPVDPDAVKFAADAARERRQRGRRGTKAAEAAADSAKPGSAGDPDVGLPEIADQLKSLMAHVSRLQEAVVSQSRPALKPFQDAAAEEPAIPTNQSARLEPAADGLPPAPPKPKRTRKARNVKPKAPDAILPADPGSELPEPVSASPAGKSAAIARTAASLFPDGSSTSKSWEPKRHW